MSLVGMENGVAALETSLVVPQKIKHKLCDHMTQISRSSVFSQEKCEHMSSKQNKTIKQLYMNIHSIIRIAKTWKQCMRQLMKR